MKPLIGITASHRSRSHQRVDSNLLGEYTHAVARAGGLPVLIPNEIPLPDLPALIDRFDGILLSGGGDIDPVLYGVYDDDQSENISKSRDALEKDLIRLAQERDLPLLGICRGCQMLNAALGGSLFTDIPGQFRTRIVHSQPDTQVPWFLVHDVEITAGSGLFGIIGQSTLRVNSRHHQAIKELAPGLRVTARARDGLIEGVEHPDWRFCQGVQWHPESLQDMQEHTRIFTAFVEASQG